MRIKIFVVDSYQSRPSTEYEESESRFTGKKILNVPVIRVFGISENGMKCCIHVHKAFPYIYVPIESDDLSFITHFIKNLESLLSDNGTWTIISNIDIVKACSMYGYYGKNTMFAKIDFVNPIYTKKAADILYAGKMGQQYQPFHAHIPYHLQFLIDHNLFGMNWMDFEKATFRLGSWCDEIDSNTDFLLGKKQKLSCCFIECDVESADILNSKRLLGEASVSSLSALWEDERARRVSHGFPGEDVKLPNSLEHREWKKNERETVLLKKFVEIVSQPLSQQAESDEQALTQLLEGIVAEATVEHANNNWEKRTDYRANVKETSLTQCLAGIVSQAVSETSPVSLKVAETDTDIEPGSILSYSRCEDNLLYQEMEEIDRGGEEIEEEEEHAELINQQEIQNISEFQSKGTGIGDSLGGIDWAAFISESEDSEEIPQQLDGTNDRSKRRSLSQTEGSVMKRGRSSSTASSGSVPTIQLSVPPQTSVTITDKDQYSRNSNTSQQLEVPNIFSNQSVSSDLGSSSVYSFNSSLPYSSESIPARPSSENSEISIKISGSSPSISSRRSSLTPISMDQTSIQFFNEEYTPNTILNETAFLPVDLHSIHPKRKPPSKRAVIAWLRSLNTGNDFQNDTIAACLNETCASHVELSKRFPAHTSTPHPRISSGNAPTPVSTMFMDSTVIASPLQQSHFSFAAKSMKNVEPIAGAECGFAAQYLTVFSIEVYASSSSLPDPSRDPIGFISLSKMTCSCITFNNEIETLLIIQKESIGDSLMLPSCTALGSLTTEIVDGEMALINLLLNQIETLNPDILCGYEIERSSLGYLIKRASLLKIPNIVARLGRILPDIDSFKNEDNTETNLRFSSAKGRVFFSVWRLVRSELDRLKSYSFENAAFHILHRRLPKYEYGVLAWWLRKSATRTRTIFYYIERSLANIQILIRLNLLSRTSELARLYGILYYDCLSRGSQYRVEAVMLRLAKRRNFLAISPSVEQRAAQCAPECIALTLEPISNYYKSPVIVLDFQSLYPSIMIAYNYSFDTCMGRIDRLAKGGKQQLGCFRNSYEIPSTELRKLSPEKDVNISPNGIVFVKRHIRRGILSSIVEDLLNTRLMVKASMKLYKNDPTITKILDDRQLGLKLLSNVTYGYTAANFSGRMPCIEVADAIVRKGREALENAISLVTSNRNEWGGARVIYGDTDSLFVLIPGGTVQEAFNIGAKIAEAVTNSNPHPIKLKLEKVFSRCILEAKKRYCGYMYESPDQKEPEFLSKGIETMRKDQCTFVANVLEKSIRILFTTDNNAQVMRYLKKQIKMLESGSIEIPDLLLSREYRGSERYSEKGSAAAMLIANKRRMANPLSEPLPGERVSYMITVDAPGSGIMQTAREPIEVVANGLRPNVDYYIRKQLLPALDRALGTAGINVFNLISGGVHFSTYGNVAEQNRVRMPTYNRVMAVSSSKVITLTQMYSRRQCVICGSLTTSNPQQHMFNRRYSRYRRRDYSQWGKVCANCKQQPATSSAVLSSRCSAIVRKVEAISLHCQSCCRFRPFFSVNELQGGVNMLSSPSSGDNNPEIFVCSSPDCPLLYEQYNRQSLLTAAHEYESINKAVFSRTNVIIDDDDD